jgi:hypothetical protein
LTAILCARRTILAGARPQPQEMREIFARLGLAGDFWNPQSDAFG